MILFKPRIGKVIFAQTTRGLSVIIPKFKHLKELRTSVNQSKSSGPRTPGMIEFKFKHLKRLKDEQYKHFI